MKNRTASVTMTLYNEPSIQEKLEVMNTLEVLWDDERNPISEEVNWFVEDLPLGSKVKITFELLEDIS